jgi:hypothetical protein
VNENTESLDHALGQVAKLNFLTVLTFDPEEGYNAVIYADGENHEGNASNPAQAVREAAAKAMKHLLQEVLA